ncbi:MED26 [Trypoxylus dichotomus]
MQNNVTELTQKLLRALDAYYNVIDMPAVIEVISLLEKVTITKELLETTRLGRHVNELRRSTTDDSLAKRAKELVKKWRSLVLPDSNGQLKPVEPQIVVTSTDDAAKAKKRLPKEKLENVNVKRSRVNGGITELDFSDNSNSSFKDVIGAAAAKAAEARKDIILINSDSNSSFPDGAKNDPVLEQQQPKKRGRKKGSKNHRNLLDEAETSFSNKMAVSRGNAKVKTTQELIASLQKSSSLGVVAQAKSKEDLMEKAAKLTERVSIIDQKLNTSGNRYKNSQRKNSGFRGEIRNDRILESGSVTNVDRSPGDDKSHNRSSHTDDEIIVVDEETDNHSEIKPSDKLAQAQQSNDAGLPKSLSVEDALALLPPIDKSCLYEADDIQDVSCTCPLEERKTDFSIEAEDDDEDETKHGGHLADDTSKPKFEFKEDCNCQAKLYLEHKYHLGAVTDDRVFKLRDRFVPGLNGNLSAECAKAGPDTLDNGLYVNVVPNRNTERIPKCFDGVAGEDFACENFKKYSISEEGDTAYHRVGNGKERCGNISDGTDTNSNNNNNNSTVSGVDATVTSDVAGDTHEGKSGSCATTFREWHEVVEMPSYNVEMTRRCTHQHFFVGTIKKNRLTLAYKY